MRTTIELTEEQRAELLKLAAQRGLKGFSSLIQEAVDTFLNNQASRVRLIEAALAMKGTLQNDAADEFEERTKSIRKIWR